VANKTDFTPDEWKVLLESAMMAGIAVTAADPSGLWGTLKETFTSARSMIAGRSGASDARKILHTLRDLCAANLDLMALLSKRSIN
jgi:hypothetical protein